MVGETTNIFSQGSGKAVSLALWANAWEGKVRMLSEAAMISGLKLTLVSKRVNDNVINVTLT